MTLQTFLAEPNTEHGIDKLNLMAHFFKFDSAANKNEMKRGLNEFKRYVEQQIKRELTAQEYADLLQGIANYFKGEAETPERYEAIFYLFGAKFLTT